MLNPKLTRITKPETGSELVHQSPEAGGRVTTAHGPPRPRLLVKKIKKRELQLLTDPDAPDCWCTHCVCVCACVCVYVCVCGVSVCTYIYRRVMGRCRKRLPLCVCM